MTINHFFIVDVFAEEKYTGNQLAVFTNAGNLSDWEMQQIAKEINYSETTFISSPETKNGGYDVRIFTPNKELPFAGHPTLGTAYIIQKEFIKESVETVKLNLKVGQIPVTFPGSDTNSYLWMKQQAPSFNQTFNNQILASILSIEVTDIDDRFPIQSVSTGIPFIIVPLKTHQALQQVKINQDKYYALVNTTVAKEILIFCPETYKEENNLSVRVFADYLGIPEDPATGSANGCLAGYLVKYSYFAKEAIDVRVEQGYEIGRPSLLLLKAEKKEGEIEVFVGGKVILIAKGELI